MTSSDRWNLDRPKRDAFTAEPSAERARNFHTHNRAMMLDHFVDALQSAAEGLKINLDHLLDSIERLDPIESMSPAAYLRLTHLTEALNSGDVTRVMDALQAIRRTTHKEFTDSRFRIDSILSEHWEQIFVDNARQDPVEGLDETQRIMRPILETDLSGHLAGINDALDLLRDVDTQLALEFDEIVSRIKLFIGRGYLGLSSPAAFGAIYVRVPHEDPMAYFLEHLVHELSHLYLNTIMIHDPLLKNPMDKSVSPLREGQRPLYQVLHATFVLGRNVRVSRRVVQNHPELGLERHLEAFETQYSEGYNVIQYDAQLTDLGRQFLETMEPMSC